MCSFGKVFVTVGEDQWIKAVTAEPYTSTTLSLLGQMLPLCVHFGAG